MLRTKITQYGEETSFTGKRDVAVLVEHVVGVERAGSDACSSIAVESRKPVLPRKILPHFSDLDVERNLRSVRGRMNRNAIVQACCIREPENRVGFALRL